MFICEEVANIPRVVRQSRTTELLTAMDIDDSRVGLLDLLEKLESDKSQGPDLYIVSLTECNFAFAGLAIGFCIHNGLLCAW